MLEHDTRVAILRLARQGHGIRAIAKAVGVSRDAVRAVLRSGSAEVPDRSRPSRLDPHLEQIRELHAKLGGNRVLVHEALAREGIVVPYSTVTDYCRHQGIGEPPAKPLAGRYVFSPGEEGQHDTSPHALLVAGVRQLLQCAALVLCFARMIFAQYYPTWNRFWAKVFLTDALIYFGGAPRRMMVDNLSVIVARGSGKNALIAPEMQAFAKRFGFVFQAHERGDVNRSARVERTFSFVETGFHPEDPADLAELNAQVRVWCDRVNARYRRHLRARPIDLFVVERPALVPLPIYVPEVYRLYHRTVDSEGYVNLHLNRYSVPAQLRDHALEVRETKDQVRIFEGPGLVVEHPRLEEKAQLTVTRPEHRRPRRKSEGGEAPVLPEEKTLRAAGPELASLVEALKRHHGGRAVRALKRLHRLFVDYSEGPLRAAVAEALHYGLLDLERLEHMVLRRVGEEVFRAPEPAPTEADQEDEEDGR